MFRLFKSVKKEPSSEIEPKPKEKECNTTYKLNTSAIEKPFLVNLTKYAENDIFNHVKNIIERGGSLFENNVINMVFSFKHPFMGIPSYQQEHLMDFVSEIDVYIHSIKKIQRDNSVEYEIEIDMTPKRTYFSIPMHFDKEVPGRESNFKDTDFFEVFWTVMKRTSENPQPVIFGLDENLSMRFYSLLISRLIKFLTTTYEREYNVEHLPIGEDTYRINSAKHWFKLDFEEFVNIIYTGLITGTVIKERTVLTLMRKRYHFRVCDALTSIYHPNRFCKELFEKYFKDQRLKGISYLQVEFVEQNEKDKESLFSVLVPWDELFNPPKDDILTKHLRFLLAEPNIHVDGLTIETRDIKDKDDPRDYLVRVEFKDPKRIDGICFTKDNPFKPYPNQTMYQTLTGK